MIKKINDIKFSIIFLSFGILIFGWQCFCSGFDLLPGDNIDSRFINYILEHFRLWMLQVEPHKSFWDMPCLYPAKNTLAYSDVLLGIGVIYVPIRFFANEFHSFLITVFILCFLNFSTFYFLLKKCFNYKYLASAVGAFFFAFSIIRYGHMIHVQLLSQFYTILAIICFIKSKKYAGLSFLGCIFAALQLYTSIYMGWFFGFAVIIFTLILLFFSDFRNNIFQYAKNNYIYIISNIIFFCLLISPLAIHYLSVGITKYSFEHVLSLTPNFKDYIINNGFFDNLIIFKQQNFDFDLVYGIGILTNILVIYGIFKFNKYKFPLILFVVLIVALINIQPLYKLIYNYVPGAGAIRAVGRYINILCPVYALIIANFVNGLNKQALKWCIVAIIVLEQIPAQSLFKWSAAETQNEINKYKIPQTCSVIFLDYSNIPSENNFLLDKIEMDGVWIALKNHVYTVNGYPTIPMKRISFKLSPECIIELK